jgi:hypothetical protein
VTSGRFLITSTEKVRGLSSDGDAAHGGSVLAVDEGAVPAVAAFEVAEIRPSDPRHLTSLPRPRPCGQPRPWPGGGSPPSGRPSRAGHSLR